MLVFPIKTLKAKAASSRGHPDETLANGKSPVEKEKVISRDSENTDYLQDIQTSQKLYDSKTGSLYHRMKAFENIVEEDEYVYDEEYSGTDNQGDIEEGVEAESDNGPSGPKKSKTG